MDSFELTNEAGNTTKAIHVLQLKVCVSEQQDVIRRHLKEQTTLVFSPDVDFDRFLIYFSFIFDAILARWRVPSSAAR